LLADGNLYHAVSLSGGKDSTAMLLLMIERGMPVDAVLTADPERKALIYDDITQGLDAFNFWHSNIKIATDISVPL